jgi:hypothetical protein
LDLYELSGTQESFARRAIELRWAILVEWGKDMLSSAREDVRPITNAMAQKIPVFLTSVIA